jgi:hypothetical protein
MSANTGPKDALMGLPEEPVVEDNMRILYITLAVIVGLIILWIVIVIFTREDAIKILGEMNNAATQIAPVSDKPALPNNPNNS